MPFNLYILFLLINSFGVKPEVIFVKGGNFTLGKTEKMEKVFWEKLMGKEYFINPMDMDIRKNKISISINSFYLSKYETTNEQFCKFLNQIKLKQEKYLSCPKSSDCSICKIKLVNGKFQIESGFEEYPVTCVTWYGANAYCKWIGGRLPTSFEWEYAARGGQKSNDYLFSGSNDCEKVAVFNKNKLSKIGSKEPNELGIYDLSGNVIEWCQDWFSIDYHLHYKILNKHNPQGPSEGKRKVIKGGHWKHKQDLFLQNTSTKSFRLELANNTIGFRVLFEK